MICIEPVRGTSHIVVAKFKADIALYRQALGPLRGEEAFYRTERPYDLIERLGNVWTRGGIEEFFKLATGAAATAYSNANARIGVGSGTTPATDQDTALEGPSTFFMAMNTGYPLVGSGADKKTTWQGTAASGEAQFHWQEIVIDNGAVAAIILNHAIEDLGTKGAETWLVTIETPLA